MCWPYAYLVILWPFGSLDATELVLVKRALDNREVELKELKTALRAIRLTDTDQIARLDIIESNINNLISGFSARLTSNEYALTPREIQIAALIKDGKTTKEIAEYLSVSTASIDFHRNNIRTIGYP